MKCNACGYEDNYVFTENGTNDFTGDERFIHVIGTFHIKRKVDWGMADVRVEIYACPKCKTLILEK